MTLVENTLNKLRIRRQNVLNGNVNCIPSPFKRFKEDFPGLERECYITLTSFTKGSKTQFGSFLFIYNSLLYAYRNPDKVNVNILYFGLEESAERILERFMSWILYNYTKHTMRISPSELRSTIRACPEEALNYLENDEVIDILNFFEQHIVFSETSNPTGIRKEINEFISNKGTIIKESFTDINEFGVERKREKIKEFIPNSPNDYNIIFIDTMNNIEPEKGIADRKTAIDVVSKDLIWFRNKFKISIVAIQQQAFQSEDNFAIKMNKVRPSVAGLGDSKYVARDSNIVLGLFSPQRFGITRYPEGGNGYDITIFKDNIRFLEVIVNRDGQMGGMLPLYFDGAICNFRELPLPNDTEGLKKIYSELNLIRSNKVYTFFTFLLNKIKHNDRITYKKK